ncbi:hypothetical protein KC19_3G096000 [Ceratodon purpureus]|nr:hypothetical protein KC19_3G096000 [Ceratodon purpureus]
MLADEDKSRWDADYVCKSEVISKSKFKILFLDMDGTILNTKSVLTRKTADALRAAMKNGVMVIIATGKTRPAAMAALDPMGLAGQGGVVSESTPGIFIQGLQVYGKEGKVISSSMLDLSIVEETFKFSVEHQTPLTGFCGDRCVTLFPHTLIDELHDVFYEPAAEVLGCMDEIKKSKVQKVLFHDSAARVTSFLRPHWSLALQGKANVVQSLPDMLEVLPHGASKGAGVQILLDHLEIPPDQAMAIGDGENDIEMLTLVGWGVAMGNANSLVKSAAKAVTGTNDEDGVAKAIYEYIL